MSKGTREVIPHQRYKAALKSYNTTESTLLTVPNRTALRSVKVGDLLRAEYRPGPPPLLVAMTKNGSAAGAIDSRTTRAIIDCIQCGIEYDAQVTSIKGLKCRVRMQVRTHHNRLK